jgi:D-threo-aldose 1-dehydrogenase
LADAAAAHENMRRGAYARHPQGARFVANRQAIYCPIGSAGLKVPPIIFAAGPLADGCRIIAEPTKTALCVEWFKAVQPPLAVEFSDRYDLAPAAAVFENVRQRVDIPADECLRLLRTRDVPQYISGAPRIKADVILIDGLDQRPPSSGGLKKHPQNWDQWKEGMEALASGKTAGLVKGIGAAVAEIETAQRIADAFSMDCLMLAGLTPLDLTAASLGALRRLAERKISIVAGSIFGGGFLLGGSHFAGKRLHPDLDRQPFAWRTAFTALCHGHGVSPAEACVQFILSLPGVVAVVVNTSRPERVAELVAAAGKTIPKQLWLSLYEEGLIDASSPVLA